ncbi:MAG: alpha/beta fold hydrolase [Ferrovibrio sp.]|uniref:alpha/beta fold hydrolase n=1 Tax=Ferrovibrio sp. TaxID=1917215 RepID=UPI00391AF289
MTHLLFLPGAGGAAEFWHPLGQLLPDAWEKTYLNWPGLGHEPHAPGYDSLDALTQHAEKHLAPSGNVILAHSMGGIFAMRLALRHPQRISRMVLTAASGGLDVARFGATDWRPEYRAEYPRAADWIMKARADHTPQIGDIRMPVLLLWGDADSISPVSIGRHLQDLLPQATLHVIKGGDHGFPRERAADIASLVTDFIGTSQIQKGPQRMPRA